MTCIVGLKVEGGVWLAGDAAWTDGPWIAISTAPKVFAATLKYGTQIGVGVAGCPRVTQVLQHGVDWPDLDPPEPDGEMAWFVNVLVPRMIAVLGEHEVAGADGKPGTLDGNLLVAVNGRLFAVYTEWQVSERPCGFDAVGSGHAEAIGALRVLHGAELDPAEVVERAMRVAVEFNANVAPPFATVFVAAQS